VTTDSARGARPSIQRRLLWSTIAVIVAAIAVTAVVVYRQARDEANDLFDLQLRQIAASLPVRAFGGLAPPAAGVEAGEDIVIRIWNRVGVFVYSSHPEIPLPARAQLGLSTVATPRGDWRVYASIIDDNLLEVAQPMRVRGALAAAVAFRTVLPLLLLLPVIALLLWWVVGRGLAPLRRIAGEVATRRPEDLAHVSEDALPDEVAPLVASLNGLLDDLARARDTERAFIADAAHALRTPLTAVQLQLQVAERESDPAARAAALAALHGGLVRASRLVEQLLSLARSERAEFDGGGVIAAVDLVALARDVVAAHAPLAHDKGIDLGVVATPTDTVFAVDGDRDALHTLVSNLVDNALRYTPRGGRVDVDVTRTSDRIALSVVDDGPGVAPDERERVFDRFHRGEAARAAQETRGSGLGLAIVKRIAARHAATVELATSSGGHGLTVTVSFAPREGPADPSR